MEKNNKQAREMTQCLELLRKRGCRITPQRRAVLSAFAECQRFPTALELLGVIRHLQPDVSLDTVYRNLTLFTELGIVHEVHRPSGNAFEIVAPGHHHHHLVCTECGRTECIDICPMNEIYEKEAEKHGFLVTGHVFEFYGLCWSCRNKMKNGKK